jgi:amino acid permease
MLRDIFSSLGGIEKYGIISTLIFVIFFVMLIIQVVSLKRDDMDRCSRMPLDDSVKEKDDLQDIK